MTDKTGLTIVTPTFLPEINGVTASLNNLIPHLIQDVPDIRVLSPDYGKVRSSLPSCVPQAAEFKIERINYPSIQFGGYPFARKPRPFSLRVRSRYEGDRILVLEPDRLQYGNILSPLERPQDAFAFFRQDYFEAARRYHSPSLFKLTGPLLRRFIAWVYNQYRAVFVLSGYARDNLLNIGVSVPITTLAQGIDDTRFLVHREAVATEPPLRVVYVGRMALEKNVALLEQTFRPGRFDSTRVRLDCYGDGPLLESFKCRSDPKVVTCHGFVEQDKLAAVLNRAHLFISPCPVETFGNALVEAMACGCPAVGVAAGANLEHIQAGRNGYLIENSAHDLASLIDRLQEMPLELFQMRVNCENYARGFTWGNAARVLAAQLNQGGV